MRFSWVFAIVALVCSADAIAQDYSTIGQHRATYQSKMRHVYGSDATTRADPRGGPIQRPSLPAVSPPASTRSLSFEPNVRQRDAVYERFMARVRQSDPQAADVFDAQHRSHNVFNVYSNIARQYGFDPNDLGDTLAAYKVLSWLIMQGELEPERAALSATRTQIANLSRTLPEIDDETFRLQFASELQIQFVAMHAGWRDALSDGPGSAKARQYASGVADAWHAQFGDDLRQVEMTAAGFVRR